LIHDKQHLIQYSHASILLERHIIIIIIIIMIIIIITIIIISNLTNNLPTKLEKRLELSSSWS